MDELLNARLRHVRRSIEALEFHRLTFSFDADQMEEYDRLLTSEDGLLAQRRAECGVTAADFLTNALAELRTLQISSRTMADALTTAVVR